MRREQGTTQDILRYRLEQADRAVAAANALAAMGDFPGALNRVYHGMFYAITALAIVHGFSTRKHQQLLGWFNREFVNTGKVNKELGDAVRNAAQSRLDGDYDALVFFDEDEVARLIVRMQTFIAEIKPLVAGSL